MASVSVVAVAHLLALGNMTLANELSRNGAHLERRGYFVSCGQSGIITMPLLISGEPPLCLGAKEGVLSKGAVTEAL